MRTDEITHAKISFNITAPHYYPRSWAWLGPGARMGSLWTLDPTLRRPLGVTQQSFCIYSKNSSPRSSCESPLLKPPTLSLLFALGWWPGIYFIFCWSKFETIRKELSDDLPWSRQICLYPYTLRFLRLKDDLSLFFTSRWIRDQRS